MVPHEAVEAVDPLRDAHDEPHPDEHRELPRHLTISVTEVVGA